MSAKRLRVLLVDDHETVRDGLRLLLETKGHVDVVRDVGTGAAAIEAARALSPDVVVLDLAMPGMDGLATARVIREQTPHVLVVALTRHAEAAYVQEALAAGVVGYVLKQSRFDELLKAMTAAAAGRRYVDPAVTLPVTGTEQAPHRAGRLRSVTPRELSVLQLAAVGTSNKEIANTLRIAVKTVEVHKASAMRKLELGGRADVIAFALVKGWLRDS
jgi:DNA-binding NarL/FixJ family response regulator